MEYTCSVVLVVHYLRKLAGGGRSCPAAATAVLYAFRKATLAY